MNALLPADLLASSRVSSRSNGDADLLAACAEFMALEQRFNATNFAAEPGTAAAQRACSRQRQILKAQRMLAKRLEKMVASTLAGHSARAKCLVAWAPDLLKELPPMLGETGDLIMRAMVRDLADWSAQA